MKRIHQKTHMVLWVLLTPIIVLTIALALSKRPVDPVNDALPAAISSQGVG